jgi:hypothetical protein
MRIFISDEKQTPSTSHQTGHGTGHVTGHGKRKLDLNFDTDSNTFYNNLAEKVAEKITATSTFTNLWKPSEISTPTILSIKTPSTLPPLPFGNKIQKNLENDKFGKSNNNIFL